MPCASLLQDCKSKGPVNRAVRAAAWAFHHRAEPFVGFVISGLEPVECRPHETTHGSSKAAVPGESDGCRPDAWLQTDGTRLRAPRSSHPYRCCPNGAHQEEG